jgi:hypothetical protein
MMPRPVFDVGPLDFTETEITHLLSFADGAIMAPDIREHLQKGWGLCPRHAWGYAVAEIEVRRGRPFSTAILYEDLAGRAARLLGQRHKPWGRLRSPLRTRSICFTCDYVSMVDGRRGPREHAPTDPMMGRVNERSRTRAMFEELGDLALERACPSCLGGGGLICRLHLLEHDGPPDALVDELGALAARLRALVNSMNAKRSEIGSLEAVSWIEALGWFGGWDYARKLSDQQTSATTGTDS